MRLSGWSIMKHKLLQEFPSVLETDRLVIRRYQKGDGKGMYDLFERNNNRELLKEHVDEATDVNSEDDAEYHFIEQGQ